MKQITYSISSDIFEQFPDFMRGVVLAYDVKNSISPAELIHILRQAESAVCQHLELDDLAGEPHLVAWREAFRKMGMKPTDYRSSVEALVRRVLHGQEIPSINTLVDIGNIISLRHLIPVGGHAIDHLEQDISLRMATGEEEFFPFGSDQMEHPEKDEIIFTAGNTVLTRRWIWRQANYTLTLPETKAIEINLDGLPPTDESVLNEIATETMGMIRQFCGGEMEYKLLKKENLQLVLRCDALRWILC